MTRDRFFIKKFLVFICLFSFNSIFAKELIIAVATNFYAPMKMIVEQYSIDTETNVKIVAGSSGKLATQIIHGAPYDIFFSADQTTILNISQHSAQLSSVKVFTYAIGSLVIWSPNKRLMQENNPLLNQQVKKISIANPTVAPYGKAAQEYLKNTKQFDELKSKLVFGENISQAYQFVISQNSQIGLIALSQVYFDGKIKMGAIKKIDNKLYPKIFQDALVIENDKNKKQIEQFLEYFKTDKVQDLILKFGYRLPRLS